MLSVRGRQSRGLRVMLHSDEQGCQVDIRIIRDVIANSFCAYCPVIIDIYNNV